MKLLGIDLNADEQIHSEQELRIILAESQEGGMIYSSEYDLIQNVFDFDDRTVKQIMSNAHDIVIIDPKSSPDEIMSLIIDEGYSRYPVYEGDIDNIIDVVHPKNIVK